MGRRFHTIWVATASPGGRVARRDKMRKNMRKEEKIRNTDRNFEESGTALFHRKLYYTG